ncbi:HD domain-containing protein [Micromonospora echinofusca]|uniref:HD domain-containing protein n=1 Tax=Micromonospora echinofusca TaxID=47858 RepID=UPI0034281912
MTHSFSRRTALGTGLAAGAGVLTGLVAATPAAAHDEPDADLAFPSTRLAREAIRLIEDAQEAYLRNHSLRSFLFAREAAALAGRRPGRDYDEEVVFLICALHDMGLTGHANSDQRFEMDGADFAARFLEERGVTDRRVDTVWDAIAMHTTRSFRDSPVFQRRRPPEIGIAQTGIGIDLMGTNSPVPPAYAERVHRRHPRLGGARAVTDAIEAQALANPRKAPAATLPGEILHQRHPELPYLTWDMLLDANAWGD